MTDNKTREQIQQEVEAAAKRAKRQELTKRALKWGGVAVFLVALVGSLAYLASGPSGQTGGQLSDAVAASDWQKGNPNAKVTLVEYSDFQCPYCAIYQPYIKTIMEKYGADVRLVFRNFPLPGHRNARAAAQAAEAAGLQGKFWEMHDLLFSNQTQWENTADPSDIFAGYATSLGIDMTKFKQDYSSAAVASKIAADSAGGNRSNVQATPSFFLNGAKLTLSTYADLEQAVSAALK